MGGASSRLAPPSPKAIENERCTMPSIDRNSSSPFYYQVYEQIARGIESGLYPVGKKLPSIRECARELGVSNTTIELAYQRLTEEGYVQARRGSGYVICAIDAKPSNPTEEYDAEYRKALEELMTSEVSRSDAIPPLYDFAYDAVDATIFPFTTWARMSREVFFNKGVEASCLYNDRQGLPELREQIARYLSGEYGLNCIAEQVLVMPTTRDIVSSILSVFDPHETTFAMEEPGYDEIARKLNMRGFKTKTIPVHPFPSFDEAKPFLEGADIVFATPACQFPSNQPMPLELRRNLVNWARDTGAYLIDDEYGWEFQSGVARVPSLAALDRSGHVISIGTFSNSFTPAVCLSYAVLPPQLMSKWQKLERDAHPQVPWQTQAAMAAFMEEGLWRTHIRKVRTSAKNKRRQLINSLTARMGDSIQIVEGLSSLFVLVQTNDGRDEDELIATAAKARVKIYPTRRYWSGGAPDDWRYVLIGYAGIPFDAIDSGVATLARSWGFGS